MKPTIPFCSICLSALLLCACRDTESLPPGAATPIARSTPATQNTGSPVSPLFRWKDGQASRYTLRMAGSLKGAADTILLNYSLTAGVDIIVASHSATSETILLKMINPVLSVDGEASQTQKKGAALLQAELLAGAMGQYREGRLQKMKVPLTASVFGVGIWRSILSALQISDKPGDLLSYEVTEWDENGEYTALYEHQDNGWQKTKKAYRKGLQEDRDSLMGPAPKPVIVASEGHFRMEEGRLESLQRKETVEVAIAAQQRLIGTLEMQFDRVDPSPEGRQPVVATGDWRTLKADEPYVARLPIDAMDAARMGNLTFDQVLAALEEKARDPRRQKLVGVRNNETADSRDVAEASEWADSWSRLFSALPAFFRQQPDTIRRATVEIRNNSAATTSLLGGLSAAGTEASQEALLAMAEDRRLPDALRIRAMRNLIQCAHPLPQIGDRVRSLYKDTLLQRYAVFGAGTFSRKLRLDGHAQAAENAIEWLLELLNRKPVEDEQRDVLQAISNSGHPSALAPMKELASSANPLVRAGALEAMRLIDHPDVATLYINHQNPLVEHDAIVRMTTVRSCADLEPTDELTAALLETAGNDPQEDIRKEAIRILQSFYSERPELQDRVESLRAQQ